MTRARMLLVVAALVGCAWFALGIRQARDTAAARALISAARALDPGQARHAGTLLDGAGALNPDSEVDLLRAQLALIEQQRIRAARILGDVIRREPMNIRAWVGLVEATSDPRVRNEAIAMIARLDPIIKRRGGRRL